MPAARRADYVAATVKRLSIWPDAEWHSVIADDEAQIWIWSRAEVRSSDEAGPSARHARIIPETLMRGEPRPEGGELIAMHRGYEGRAWKRGSLLATHWWASAPDVREWALFCRSSGMPVGAMPAVQAPPLREQPWLEHASSARLIGRLQAHRRALLAALALVFCAGVGYQSGAVVRLYVLIGAAQNRIDAQRAAASDILDARAQAERSRAALQSLLAAVARPQALDALSRFTRAMPGGNWHLVQWYQPSPGRIEATLQGSALDPPGIVRALDRSGGFAHVTANISPADPSQLLVTGEMREPPQTAGTGAPSP